MCVTHRKNNGYERFCYLWAMNSQKDFNELQKIPLEERIERVQKMLAEKEEPRGFELGVLLALKMGKEIRERKPLGSESGELVKSWNGKYSESTIEEAIATAKEFMLHPGSLAEKIKAGIEAKSKARDDEK